MLCSFSRGNTTKSARKKHLQEILSQSTTKMKAYKPSSTLEIVFANSDLEGVVLGYDDPMVILARIVNADVKRVFID